MESFLIQILQLFTTLNREQSNPFSMNQGEYRTIYYAMLWPRKSQGLFSWSVVSLGQTGFRKLRTVAALPTSFLVSSLTHLAKNHLFPCLKSVWLPPVIKYHTWNWVSYTEMYFLAALEISKDKASSLVCLCWALSSRHVDTFPVSSYERRKASVSSAEVLIPLWRPP